ncbi:MAG: hypothetical protein LBV58_01465 [Acholeplasmatales bacterium]|jgi:flotillin|nr:hypothetical protein [Acholeplasmatales bacterium]
MFNLSKVTYISPETVGLLIAAVVIIVVSVLIFIVARIRKCPSDKILVVYGKIGNGKDGQKQSAICLHGGAKFVWPVVQAFQYLDLTPLSIQVDLKSALSRQNIRIDVPSRFTVGISTEQGVMQNAAERLLGLRLSEVQELAKDIIFGQLRLVIAQMEIEEINTDRDKFLEAVSSNVETELKKIGLRLINVNITDINDESGYIEALGKEAAAKAINDAKKTVAEKNRDGSIGEANALREQRIQVANANSLAIAGENKALGDISQSDATRKEIVAESLRRSETAEYIAKAKTKEESYVAEQKAEIARAEREKATLQADVLIKAEIEKEKIVIAAEADAEDTRRRARGEADAIFAKLDAEAKGSYEILTKQAEGFLKLIGAANHNTDAAVKLLIADKLEKLVELQVNAISNIKFDKITVWDSGSKNGESATAGFASSLLKSIPPLNDLFQSAGMKLPNFLGTSTEEGTETKEEVTKTEPVKKVSTKKVTEK